tara:strand:- start:46 stop:447 length:402 start_codon:yes stop_codon:yes gene_type:complete
VGVVEDRFVGQLVEGIRQGGSGRGSVVEELAEEAQEELKAFPVALAVIETLGGHDPLASELTSAPRGEHFAESSAIIIGKIDSEACESVADISVIGSQPLGEDHPDGGILIIKKPYQVREFVLYLHDHSAIGK